jgi:hypothetical protein
MNLDSGSYVSLSSCWVYPVVDITIRILLTVICIVLEALTELLPAVSSSFHCWIVMLSLQLILVGEGWQLPS